MGKFLLLLLNLLSLSFLVPAQSADPMQVMPPSPTSREFDKYINYQVALYNGVPEISIPLYEIRMGKTSIPIVLNYHASGIKFGQSSGDVGVGWVLEPGHRVSRTINGRVDEYFGMPSLDALQTMYTPETRDVYLSKFIGNGGTDNAGTPTTGEYFDGEFDLFTYSTISGAGAFVIKDRVQRQIQQISESTDCISYNQLSGGLLEYFIVRDGNGLSHRFGKSTVSGQSAVDLSSGHGAGRLAASSWHLTNINDSFSNYANFTYSGFRESTTLTGQTLSARSGADNGDCYNWGSALPNSIPVVDYDIQRVQEIRTKEVVVTFFRSGTVGKLDVIEVRDIDGKRIRKIVFNYSGNQIHSFLDSVLIYGQNDQDPKRYGFEYYSKDSFSRLHPNFAPDYWGYYKLNDTPYPHYPTFEEYYYCDRGSDGSPYSVRVFGSRMNQINRNPTGNDNPMTQADAVHFTLKKVTYPTGGSTMYEYEPNKYRGLRDDGQGDVKYAGIRIKKITSDDLLKGETLIKEYKYGFNEDGFGYVAIDIANKKYFVKESLSAICNSYGLGNDEVLYSRVVDFSTELISEIGGGGYMGSPVHYETVVEYEKKYSLLTWQDGYGSTEPLYTNGKTEYLFNLSSGMDWAGFDENYYYSSMNGINQGDGANAVSICPASVRDPSYSIREFDNYYILRYATWDKPVLGTKTIFKANDDGTAYDTVSKEVNTYTANVHEPLWGLKVRRFVSAPYDYMPPASGVTYYANGINSLFDYGMYEVSCGNRVLSRRLLTTYSTSGAVTYATAMGYNSDFQLAREEASTSDGATLITRYRYPMDYGEISGTDAVSQGVKKLQQSHVLNALVERVTERVGPGTGQSLLVGGLLQVYRSDVPLAGTVLLADPAGAVTNFKESYNNGGAVVYDTRYEPRLVYDAYDSNGNLLQQHQVNGIQRSYLWAYNKILPIAEAQNASYQDIYHTSFEDAEGNSSLGDAKTGEKSRLGGYVKTLNNLSSGLYTLNFWQKSGETWVFHQLEVPVGSGGTYTITLTGQVDELRFYPAGAYLTTYTYDPLVGVTSSTDNNGRTTHYKYDDFGRLQVVRDDAGNVLNTYEYNYRK